MVISIVGVWVSICGMVLTVHQVLAVKGQTESIERAVKGNTESISKLLTISDLSKHSQMICELHGYINGKKWEIAHLRLLEVCAMVAAIHDNREKYNVDVKVSSSILNNIKGDLKNLNMAVLGLGEIKADIIANHLDETATFLNSLCNRRKNI
jgi:hypothetical protein